MKGAFIMSKKYIPREFKKQVYLARRQKRAEKMKIAGLTALLFLCLGSIVILGFFWKASLKSGNPSKAPSLSFAKHTSADGNQVNQTGQGASAIQGDSAPDSSMQGTSATDSSIQDSAAQKSAIHGNSSQASGRDTAWYLTLVNKQTPIPQDYEPDLVKVPGGESVDARIYDSLMQMLEDAREGNWGELPSVVSGYRTAKVQQKLYDDKIREYEKEGYSESEAAELAEQWVAVPGYSEHQLGFAVDINGATYDVYLWLQENSYKYGFIFRYPGNKTDITGVSEEVWHYRYVGKEAAAEMYEQGLCLEEYLENM